MSWRFARYCPLAALVVRDLEFASGVGDLVHIVNDHSGAIVQRQLLRQSTPSHLPFGIRSVSTVRFPFGSAIVYLRSVGPLVPPPRCVLPRRSAVSSGGGSPFINFVRCPAEVAANPTIGRHAECV
jgi:hypothetical protein